MSASKTKQVQELLSNLIDETNSGSRDAIAKGLVEALKNNHPTLVQSFLGCLNEAAYQYTKEDPNVDMRMTAGKEFLAHISKFEGGFPYI